MRARAYAFRSSFESISIGNNNNNNNTVDDDELTLENVHISAMTLHNIPVISRSHPLAYINNDIIAQHDTTIGSILVITDEINQHTLDV